MIVYSYRWITDLHAFFSSQGADPLVLKFYNSPRPIFLSLFYFSDSLWMASLHFFALSVAGLCLILGYFPRWASVIAYIFQVSLLTRANAATYGVDQLLATTLFGSFLLPSGKPQGIKENNFTSISSAVVLAQMAWLYFHAGFAKSTDVWWTQGSAIYYALNTDLFTRPWAHFLLKLPYWLLQLLSRVVLAWERFAPLLFFSPLSFAWCRAFAVIGFVVLHLSFSLFMAVGVFPLLDIALILLLIPSDFWDWLFGSSVFSALPDLKSIRLKSVRHAEVEESFTASVALAACILIFVWNLKDFQASSNFPMWAKRIVRMIPFRQSWDFFAPVPLRNDGWFVIQGETLSGRPVDVLRGRENWADFRKPSVVSEQFPSERWIPFFKRIHGREKEPARFFLGDYLCRSWSGHEPLRELNLWWISEYTPEFGQRQFVTSHLLLHRRCPLARNQLATEGD